MGESFLCAAVPVFFFCGWAAAMIASEKNATMSGFFMGLLFGPFGLIAAGFLDGRPNCPACGTRLNVRNGWFAARGGYPYCPGCKVRLDWTNGDPQAVTAKSAAPQSNGPPAKQAPALKQTDPAKVARW